MHAGRKSYDLHKASKSELAAKSLEYIGRIYEIEREAKAQPITDELHQWPLAHRQ